MFRYRVISLICLLTLTLGGLWWTWKVPVNLPLPNTTQEISSTQRWELNLGGTWNKFSTLRQAWALETQRISGKTPKYFLTDGEQFQLPASQGFSVATRRFRVPSEWSARAIQFVVSGLKGHATIYLNGVDTLHQIGEIEGSGIRNAIDIPTTAFRYGEDNVLIIQMTASRAQRGSLFSLTWPGLGEITGQVRLQAVVETTLTNPEINVAWQGDDAVVTIETQLIHQTLSESGPWTVSGVLSDGSAEVAQQSLTIKPDGSSKQAVVLKFDVPGVQRWSNQNPYLYQLLLTVSNSRGDQDNLALPIGLRSVALEEGKWQLNQETLAINGSVLSPEREAQLRNAGEVESFLESEHQKGVNLLYFPGFFPDELWLQTADQMGLGIWVEWPVVMVPESRLPKPAEFRAMLTEASRHPSIWAWTIGKGLENGSKTTEFVKVAENLVAPDLAFALKFNTNPIQGLPPERSLMVQGNSLKGSWGQVINEGKAVIKPKPWSQERFVSQVWLGIILILSWMNLRTVSWRYKEIAEKKPKRRLRKAWFWQGWAFQTREATLAGVMTAGLYHIPNDWGPWVSHLWPSLEYIQYQSPWLIWATLSFFFILLRLLQVGMVATHLPDSPNPLGLVYWLERRYRWVVLVALIWALVPFGLPIYTPLAIYFVLNLLFLPFRIRDIHRIGGRYKPFLLLPGLVGVCMILWGISHWADWFFLWHFFM